jgi:predicted transcriptional regulator
VPDRQVTISVSLLGLQDASVAAQNFGSDLKNVGTAAAEATAQAAPLGPAIDAAAAGLTKTSATAKEAAPALNAVETAAKTLQTALDKLAASDGPRGMIKNAALAQVALANYQTQATAAGVSTADMGRISDAAGAQISGAADKVGIFKKAQADLAAQGAMTGSQLDKLRMSGTSLNGLFDSMERTGTGLTKTIGQLGVGLGIGSIAFMGAEAAGRALIKMLSDAEEKSLRLIDTEIKGKNAAELHAAAMRALNAGLIDNSDSVEGLLKNYNLYILASGRGSQAAKQAAADFAGVGGAIKNYALETQKAETISALLEGAFKRSGAEGLRMAIDLDSSNRKIEASYRAMGDAVPIGIRKAIDAVDALAAANKRGLAAFNEYAKKMEEFPKTVKDIGDQITSLEKAYEKEAAAARDSTNTIEAARDEQIAGLREEGLSEKEYYEAKKQIMWEAEQAEVSVNAKADAAREKEVAGLETLAAKYGLTVKELETYFDTYRSGLPTLEETNKKSELLGLLQENLAKVFKETTRHSDAAGKSMGTLHENVTRLGSALEVLAD